MTVKIAALIGAASAIFAANTAAASEIVNDQGIFASVQIARHGPMGQSFVAVDRSLESIAFYYIIDAADLPTDPIKLDLFDTRNVLVASRLFTLSGFGWFDTDFTGTSLTAGSTYYAVLSADSPAYSAVVTEDNYPGGRIFGASDLGLGRGFNPPSVDLAFRIFGTTAAPVPEPATWALMLVGFGLAGAAMRRRSAVRVTYA